MELQLVGRTGRKNKKVTTIYASSVEELNEKIPANWKKDTTKKEEAIDGDSKPIRS